MISFSEITNESKYVRKIINHPTFLENFQCFLSFIVNRETCSGLHTLHITCCMMVILGKGNRDNPHKTTRHKPVESRNIYKQDNATLLDLLKTVRGNQETLALIPVWVSNHVHHRKNTSLTNTIASSEIAFERVSLKFQATLFFCESLES